MAKPHVSQHGFKPGGYAVYTVDELIVASWCPTPDGTGPATQVHLELKVKGLDAPLSVRFTGPDTLDELIKQLTEYRQHVWPA